MRRSSIVFAVVAAVSTIAAPTGRNIVARGGPGQFAVSAMEDVVHAVPATVLQDSLDAISAITMEDTFQAITLPTNLDQSVDDFSREFHSSFGYYSLPADEAAEIDAILADSGDSTLPDKMSGLVRNKSSFDKLPADQRFLLQHYAGQNGFPTLEEFYQMPLRKMDKYISQAKKNFQSFGLQA